MKRLLNFIFVLTFPVFFAQNKVFTYDYLSIPDSTDQRNILKETMILHIDTDVSHFYSLRKYISDSTLLADSKKGLMTMPLDYTIVERDIKDLKNRNLHFETRIADTKYIVEQQVQLRWNLVSEFDEILNHKVQKATTDFGGRSWTAWFSEDIPIPDGPYKFHGLPGLILKIENHTQSHRWIITGIKNTTEKFSYPELPNYFGEVKTDYKTYAKAHRQQRADPTAHLIGRIPDQTDSEGNFRTGEQIIREQKKFMLEKISKDNNIIEIDLLKDGGK